MGPASYQALMAEEVPDYELYLQRLADPLPAGPFDLVTSALAVHHLDGADKADLFGRVRGR